MPYEDFAEFVLIVRQITLTSPLCSTAMSHPWTACVPSDGVVETATALPNVTPLSADR